MLEERSLKSDLVALGLLALAVFLGLSLLSYDPADPPSQLVYPPHTQTANLIGRIGAWIAHGLFTTLGLGAYYLLASVAVCVAVLLTRRDVGEPLFRAVGWTLSLVGLTTLATLTVPWLSPGPVVGSGGYLGALGRSLLEDHFAHLGAFVLAASVSICGLLLCTDYVLIRLSAWLVRTPARGLHRGLSHAHSTFRQRRLQSRQARQALAAAATAVGGLSDVDEVDSLDEQDEEDESATARPIRVRSRAASAAPPPQPDANESTDEEVEEQDQTVAEAAPVPATSPTPPPLRVRNPADRKLTDRQMVMAAIDAASSRSDTQQPYELPSLELLTESQPMRFEEQEQDVRRKARVLERTFRNFGFNVRVVEIETGPVIAQFEVELEAGLRLSKITSLADDLAIALRVPSVRIVAPIPGKNTVGIEVPNVERQVVRLREVMEQSAGQLGKHRIPIFLGQDVSGKSMIVDLTTLPHLLIAGRTGTGKSVCLNTIIMSMLMTRRPDEVKMLLIDPKMVELTPYARLPHLMHPVVTDMKKAEAILGWAVEKMEERYALLARAGVRHVSVYNQLGEEELMERLAPESDEERAQIPRQLPYIVIVADEMADLMMTAAKEVESHIIRLAQKSRAVGIHLVLATQKPTVDVITGLIKSNLPARISFQVASRTDSRVVLDEMGADKLLGNGDLLFLWPGTSTLLRGQGAYVSDEEINQVVSCVSTTEPQFAHELVHLPVSNGGEPTTAGLPHRDEMYAAAVDVVVNEGRGSVSLLQRALGIGYGRAARLIDYMAEDGIVGQYNGMQARDVVITPERWAELRAQLAGGSSTPGKAPPSPLAARSTSAATAARAPAAPPASNTRPALPARPPAAQTPQMPTDAASANDRRRFAPPWNESQFAEDESEDDTIEDDLTDELEEDLVDGPSADDDALDATDGEWDLEDETSDEEGDLWEQEDAEEALEADNGEALAETDELDEADEDDSPVRDESEEDNELEDETDEREPDGALAYPTEWEEEEVEDPNEHALRAAALRRRQARRKRRA